METLWKRRQTRGSLPGMGIKSKGGYRCDLCQQPVPGEKSTHRARGAAGLLAAPFTGGASLLATAPSNYHCPNCGGPVRHATAADYALLEAASGSLPLAPPSSEPPPSSPPPTAPGIDWSEVPDDDLPPWRRRDRERLNAQTENEPPAPPDDESSVDGTIPAQLSQLASLHDSGALSDEEFRAAKARVLGS
jgi:hypothetical protein